jgi:hypothetical protein
MCELTARKYEHIVWRISECEKRLHNYYLPVVVKTHVISYLVYRGINTKEELTMLKKGIMRIGDTVYTLYELKTENYYRFDILKEDGDFHMDVDSILFSCYTFKNRKIYGDKRLYQSYKDTVTFLKRMKCETTSESKWEYGHYIRTVQKGEIGSRLITRTRDAQCVGEMYVHGGVTIIMRMYIDDYKLAMIPVNNRVYIRG